MSTHRTRYFGSHKKGQTLITAMGYMTPPCGTEVERFWGWLRQRLRAMDLADLKAGRRPVKKAGLKARVRALLKSPKGKEVAKNHFLSLQKTCADARG